VDHGFLRFFFFTSSDRKNSEVEEIALDQLWDNQGNGELQIPLLPKYIRMDRHVLSLDRELHRQRPNPYDLADV
jgi:hypothetical protein